MPHVQDVFTPCSPSITRTSVWAPRAINEELFARALNTHGRQICVLGETGVGKTSLVLRLLRQLDRSYIVVSCDRSFSAKDIFEKTLDNLKILKIKSKQSSTELDGELKTSFWTFISTRMRSALKDQVEQTPWSEKVSKENVIDGLLSTGMTLVIDDMEKMHCPTSKGLLADCAKALSDRANVNPEARIIFVGIAKNASEILDLDASIKSRLSLQRIPVIDSKAVQQFLFEEGFRRLGLRCGANYVFALSNYCFGLPKIAHMLGFHIATRAKNNNEEMVSSESLRDGIIDAIQEMTPEFEPDLLHAIRSNSKSKKYCKHILEIIAENTSEEVDNRYIAKKLSERLHTTIVPADFSSWVSFLKKPERRNILQNGEARGTHKFTSRLMKSYVYLKSMGVLQGLSTSDGRNNRS